MQHCISAAGKRRRENEDVFAWSENDQPSDHGGIIYKIYIKYIYCGDDDYYMITPTANAIIYLMSSLYPGMIAYSI